MKVRVEYENTPIRHIAVQCPECKRWFYGADIVDGNWFKVLRYEHQIYFAEFNCPVCGEKFGGWGEEIDIKEVGSYEECYEDCVQKKEVWV